VTRSHHETLHTRTRTRTYYRGTKHFGLVPFLQFDSIFLIVLQ